MLNKFSDKKEVTLCNRGKQFFDIWYLLVDLDKDTKGMKVTKETYIKMDMVVMELMILKYHFGL